jgi:hypothetical protein
LKIDPEDFRRYYDSLSDDALLEIERDELVPVAQQMYDQEIMRRHLMPDQPEQEQEPAAGEPQGAGFHAGENWLENSVCAYSSFVRRADDEASQRMLQARDILTAAGIPAEVKYRKEVKEVTEHREDLGEVLVPANLIMYASSILDKEIFNREEEQGYRMYFSSLSDEELRSADPKLLFAGLVDRLERARKAYYEEVAKRALPANV